MGKKEENTDFVCVVWQECYGACTMEVIVITVRFVYHPYMWMIRFLGTEKTLAMGL